MNEQKLVRGQNILVLRYSSAIRIDIIEQHQAIIAERGYCWYGKLGGITREIVIHAIKISESPIIMLYSKGKAFLCDFVEMTTEKPIDGYPKYYDEQQIYPSCYFKLTSIEPVDLSILNHLYVRSSKRKLSEVFSKQCMSSTLLVAYDEIKDLPKYVNTQRSRSNEKLGKENCRFKKQGICTLSSCINYQYECDRPSACAKQKR